MSFYPEQVEEGTVGKRANGASSSGFQPGGADKVKPKPGGGASKNLLALAVIVILQVLFMGNFELSASRLNRDLEQSQERVHELQTRLAAVEHSALACYSKLNATELRVVHESRIINEETRELRALTEKELEEEDELRNLRTTVAELNASHVKSKISLRYQMEERLAAEKAAQASQSSVQVIKDQLQNAQDEIKNLREKFHRETAKTQRKLNNAQKKAKDEEKSKQKYMEGMLNMQSKLGHTKSLLDTAAITAADVPGRPRTTTRPAAEQKDEEPDEDTDDPLVRVG